MQLSPLPHSKWNYTTAAHLANRAGFGGKPSEIEHLLKLGPDKAVDWFIDYEKQPDEDTAAPDWTKTSQDDTVERFAELRKLREQQKQPNLTDDQKYEIAEKVRKLNQERQRDNIKHLVEMRGDWLSRMATTQRPL
jgi:hypothetical protein